MFTHRPGCLVSLIPPLPSAFAAVLVILGALSGDAQTIAANFDQSHQREETRALVALVKDATDLVHAKGEAAFY